MTKNIYGLLEDIKGAILLKNKNTKREKYFIVTCLSDSVYNRHFFPSSIGINHIRVASDAGILQSQASKLEQIPSDGLTLPKGWVDVTDED